MTNSLKPIVRCRVPEAERYADWVRSEVRRAIATLQASGWASIAISETLGIGRTTLYRWRNGDESPEVPAFLVLMDLAEEVRTPRKVGGT